MKWEKLDLIKREMVGTDELENPVMEPVAYAQIKARLSPWTTDELQLEDRGVTKASQRMITPASYGIIKEAEKVRIDERLYNVVGRRKYGRMRALILEGYRE